MRRSLPILLGLGLVAPLAFADATTSETAPASGDAIDLTPAPSEPPGWALRPVPRVEVDDGETWLLARRHNALVYASRSLRHGRGLVRRGTALAGTPASRNEACDGRWFRVEPGGYVCTAAGFRALPADPPSETPDAAPATDAPLPYAYAMVTDREAFRYEYLPSRRLRERVQGGANLPDIAEQLNGDYFVAVAGEEEHHDETWLRTVTGDYVRAAAVERIEGSALAGVHDADGIELPLAFVYADDVRVTDASGTTRGVPKYARFGVVSVEGDTVVGAEVRAPRDGVRLVQQVPRPADVPEGARWIHVDLDEQTIVAYEGDTPIFASLVASGKEGYDTPAGTFRIRHKYVSITMRGEDPHDGVYDVAEVPWTMYYDGSYALHGAYWHDGFGNVRSHGCTNIAPADARFLFTWSTPRLPEGWHGVRADGTYVHLTRAPDDDEA